MAEFTGKDLVLNWIWSGGTVALNTDYRTASWNPTIAYADKTAGADTHVGRIPTLKDATAAVTLVDSSSTAIYACLEAGVSGTLIIQPEGTASGKRKITFPAFSNGAVPTYTYNDTTTISINFTGNGAWTDSTN
jgi:hypothetical protein